MESFSPLLGRPHPAHTHSPSRALTCSRRDSLPTARFRTRLVHTPKLGFWLRCRICMQQGASMHPGTHSRAVGGCIFSGAAARHAGRMI